MKSSNLLQEYSLLLKRSENRLFLTLDKDYIKSSIEFNIKVENLCKFEYFYIQTVDGAVYLKEKYTNYGNIFLHYDHLGNKIDNKNHTVLISEYAQTKVVFSIYQIPEPTRLLNIYNSILDSEDSISKEVNKVNKKDNLKDAIESIIVYCNIYPLHEITKPKSKNVFGF